ncbi:FHA domain-containing protein [Prochlorothrix hollandica]|nr:FHA domain-containing protein [Prochlorothrix hollandica]
MGRSKQAAVHLMGTTVSRIHAALYRVQDDADQGCYVLVDGHPDTQQPSTNGSYVNGNRITERCVLQSCDKIAFGTDVTGLFFTADPDLPRHSDFVVECRVNQELRVWAESHQIPLTAAKTQANSAGLDAAGAGGFDVPNRGEEVTQALAPPLSVAFSPVGASISPAPADRSVDTDHLLEPTYAKIGQILVRKALITQAQLEQALEQQAASNIPLGQYFIDNGLLTPESLERAVYNQRMPLGEILLRRELITSDNLRSALQAQHQTPNKRLGEILIEQGLITLEDLEASIQEQHWRRNGFWFLND